nr:cytosolic phospholipase A2 gamma-like [Misgurnus anguillicaudatus]
MSSSKLQESSEVRIGHSLNELEKDFLTTRIKTVQKCLEKLGIDPQGNVPKIALMGSGGGERAMLGLLGSLVELKKTGLLDCILYLSGVSGSTWCMASLYQDSDWSTNLDSVKEKIIQRLKGPGVSWSDAISKLKKYYYEKDIFNLTYFWAVMIVTSYVKEINEHKISEQRVHNKDPFPIYTVIDKRFRQQKNYRDTWFEISPVEAGYSLTGAFVDISKFGSQFEGGCKIKDQPEMDMLYLQGSENGGNNEATQIKFYSLLSLPHNHTMDKDISSETASHLALRLPPPPSPHPLPPLLPPPLHLPLPPPPRQPICSSCPLPPPSPRPIDKRRSVHYLNVVIFLFLLRLLNECKWKEIETQFLQKRMYSFFTELDGGECKLEFQMDKTEKNYMKDFTLAVCEHLKLRLNIWQFNLISCIIMCFVLWIWGREYNFVYKMKDDAVPIVLQDSEKRDYEDAGLCLNSSYMSVLRQERDIDLIISLDFNDGDPFETVKIAAEMCRELKIPFPKVDIPNVEYPEDFYVFKGHGEAPTVIHIPLFNTVNCGDDIDEWRERYHTIQFPYSTDMIDPLVDVAGKNITNNKEKLLDKIQACIKKKHFSN